MSTGLHRLRFMIEVLDHEPLIRRLEKQRKGRRNDYPVRAMWYSLLGAMVYGHASIGKLREELERNGEMRQLCGLSLIPRVIRVNGRQIVCPTAPSKDAYYRFIKKLTENQDLLDAMFQSLTGQLAEELPDLGQFLAIDGKAVKTARKDDADAKWGVKTQGQPDGEETTTTTVSWFGYKVHMLCDAKHELPLAFEVTKASEGESPKLEELFDNLRQNQPKILARAEALMGDRGYDSGPDKEMLHRIHGIAPIMPARDLRKGQYEALDPTRHDTIYLSSRGCVCCRIRPFEKDTDKQYAPMAFMGYEAKRDALKFRCPAAAFGIECQNIDACGASVAVKAGTYGRVVRVKLDRDRRLLGPVYHHSYRFADLYKMRTSVERLFARLDHMYGFEKHNTTGLKRMRVRLSLAMIAMQATALGWIHAGKRERIRCLRAA